MRKLLIALAVFSVVGCSGSGGNSPPPPPPPPPPFSPAPPEALSVRGNVIVGQHVALAPGEVYGVFPGMANYWDIDEGFTLSDGYDDQFDGALELNVSPLTTSPATYESVSTEYDALDYFQYDQQYDELAFFGPVAKSADGAVTATVAAADADADYLAPLSGTYSAYLNGTSDSRLWQTVALPAVADGQTLTLAWSDAADTSEGSLGASAPELSYQPYFRVAVRDTSGTLLDWAYPETTSDAGTNTFDLTPFAAQTVRISFEYRSNDYSFAQVDDVSVVRSDAPTTNLLTNGDFEAGDLTGWTVNDTGEPTGISSGVRTVDGLDVQRFFYTVPGKEWARWTDVLTNSSDAPITTDVVYYTDLGSDGGGMIYETPGASGKAITEWDSASGDRDVGFAIGDEQALYEPVQTFGSYDGNEFVYFVRHISVPAGQSVALVNFIVMNGVDTGLTATDLTAKATDIDTTLAAIVAGIRSDPQYLAGMTPEQYAAIVNW